MTPTTVDHLTAVDQPHDGSTDLHTYPPSWPEIVEAIQVRLDPMRDDTELRTLCVSDDRAGVMLTIAEYLLVITEVKG